LHDFSKDVPVFIIFGKNHPQLLFSIKAFKWLATLKLSVHYLMKQNNRIMAERAAVETYFSQPVKSIKIIITQNIF